MLNILSRIVDLNAREIKNLQKAVDEINAFESKIKKLKDIDFAKKTLEFKKRLKDESLERILPEAFALAKEASWRTLGLKHYDVQLMAGAALFQGRVVEQKTGEGKTLTAVPALYLRALVGHGAHLVTVNDYLARRDAGWNAPTFELLGMSVGVIAGEQKSYLHDPKYSDTSHGDERLEHLKPVGRKEAYSADITYGTNNEFGFDYLRDNMVSDLNHMVQRGHYFTIVDEVDSVLIDEARTPLIISAPDTEPTQKYYQFSSMIGELDPEVDYKIDEKAKSASLTEVGIEKVEKILGVDNLYEKDFESIHHIENALRARSLYLNDREYIVKDGEVIIVDEFTGRLMPGRRWSDGLHQAVEAKEGVRIQQESKTLATISFQNYFRMYEVLSGMTGTAATEADEFKKIYKLETVVIPTNKATVRIDHDDSIYKTTDGKYMAMVKEIAERRSSGQPILVGTTSIEKNELIMKYLKKARVPHSVLNAKNHEKEATIIANAGKPGAVTVATNMAGRGVDIVLGGAPPDRKPGIGDEKYKATKAYKAWEDSHKKVVKSGGLHVLGTERHESRRIDNQLRGRSGRQGDPGSTKFYLSLEDDLMRIFGGEQIAGIMDRLKLPEDQPIENKLVNRAVQQAQVKVEGFHFDARKRLVEYDDVANQQRDIIYKLRRKILEGTDLSDEIKSKLHDQIDKLLIAELGDPDPELLAVGLSDIIPFDEKSRGALRAKIKDLKSQDKIKSFLHNTIDRAHDERTKAVGEKAMHEIEKFAYLGAIDHLWIDHIDHIDSLRESIGIRAYGQRDPLVEYKSEAYSLFERLMGRIDEELAHRIFRVQIGMTPRSEIPLEGAKTNVDTSDTTGLIDEPADTVAKVGRNDPCPCGSGLKYKKCGLIGAPQHRG